MFRLTEGAGIEDSIPLNTDFRIAAAGGRGLGAFDSDNRISLGKGKNREYRHRVGEGRQSAWQ